MISVSDVRRGSQPKPSRLLIYGVHGIGKTTFAAMAPNPVFMQSEDGLGTMDASTFGVLNNFSSFLEGISSLVADDHNFQTLVIDSLDWLEPMLWAHVADENGWKDIEAPGYGKGYNAALDTWRMFLEGLNALRDEKNMTIIMLAHSEIRRFDSPENEPYDRYQPKLHAKTSALIQEHVDAVLFANYRISTVKSDVGFNKKVTRAVGGGDRILYTQERPAFLAKNRYNLPDSIPLDWQSFAELVPFYNPEANTNG